MKDGGKTLLVIGGGAAGFFCAVNAAEANPALKVVILEKGNKVLSKVRVSGGGRCNVTHACFDIPDLVKHYPRGQNFLKKAFHHFNTTHTIEWFQRRGVELKTEADGRMFPSTNSSQTIIDCLLREANRQKVELMFNSAVQHVAREGDGYTIRLQDGRNLRADYVCIACGGFPKQEQFGFIASLGHSIESPVPSLFTFNMPGNGITNLMGVSVPGAGVKVQGTKLSATGPVLITHWGMSGPAILKLSAWGARVLAELNYRFKVLVNWLGAINENELRDQWPVYRADRTRAAMKHRNPFQLPSRLWEYLLQISGVDGDTYWSQLPVKQQNLLIKHLVAHEFEVNGKTTFKEEFVTAGGVKLTEIDANTMQSRVVPNLYFAGEIMDVDGITGGFNFQNAWTTGWIAANSVAHAVVRV